MWQSVDGIRNPKESFEPRFRILGLEKEGRRYFYPKPIQLPWTIWWIAGKTKTAQDSMMKVLRFDPSASNA